MHAAREALGDAISNTELLLNMLKSVDLKCPLRPRASR
ncbi:hypothetical protein [Streptomyces collinus]